MHLKGLKMKKTFATTLDPKGVSHENTNKI